MYIFTKCYFYTMRKQKKITKIDIISIFMDDVVRNNKIPKSIDKFIASHKINLTVFNDNFSSLKDIEKEIFQLFYQNTITALLQDEGYNSFDVRNKTLSFYYTLFENLNANRAYVQATFSIGKKGLKSIKKLSKFRKSFEHYISSLEIDRLNFNQEIIDKFQTNALKKSAWVQFLAILKFWLEDTSDAFEKTDIFIEKSINTSFDLLDTKVLKSMIDLGKFIFKEKKHFKF